MFEWRIKLQYKHFQNSENSPFLIFITTQLALFLANNMECDDAMVLKFLYLGIFIFNKYFSLFMSLDYFIFKRNFCYLMCFHLLYLVSLQQAI